MQTSVTTYNIITPHLHTSCFVWIMVLVALPASSSSPALCRNGTVHREVWTRLGERSRNLNSARVCYVSKGADMKIRKEPRIHQGHEKIKSSWIHITATQRLKPEQFPYWRWILSGARQVGCWRLNFLCLNTGMSAVSSGAGHSGGFTAGMWHWESFEQVPVQFAYCFWLLSVTT